MAKSIKKSNKRLWIAVRHSVNKNLSVCGFEDILMSENERNFTISETAEQRAQAFLNSNSGSKIMAGAKTAGEAIRQAEKEKF